MESWRLYESGVGVIVSYLEPDKAVLHLSHRTCGVEVLEDDV